MCFFLFHVPYGLLSIAPIRQYFSQQWSFQWYFRICNFLENHHKHRWLILRSGGFFFPPINTFSILWRCHGWMNRGKCCSEPDFMDWRSKAQLNNLYRNPLLKLFSMIWVKPGVFLWRKYFSRFPSAAVELLCCNRLLGVGLYRLFPLSICLYSGALSSFHLCFYLSGRHTCLLVCCNYLTTLFISIKVRFNHSFDVWASF